MKFQELGELYPNLSSKEKHTLMVFDVILSSTLTVAVDLILAHDYHCPEMNITTVGKLDMYRK